MVMDNTTEIAVDGALTLVRSGALDDWYCIERAAHDGREWPEPTKYGAALMRSARISDADVEGQCYEMLGIASAIKSRGRYSAKGCAVRMDAGRAYFWSPRNSQREAWVPLAVADALADQIIREVDRG